MNKRIASFISALVLVVFCLYLVPHEIVHLVYNHEDTVHHTDDHHNGPAFSSVHVHCDFLCNYVSAFLAEEHVVKTQSTLDLPFVYSEIHVQTARCISILRDSRGPPVS